MDIQNSFFIKHEIENEISKYRMYSHELHIWLLKKMHKVYSERDGASFSLMKGEVQIQKRSPHLSY